MTKIALINNKLRPLLLPLIGAALLASCSSGPPPPDWQANAQSSMERSISAYLSGNAKIDMLEFNRAKSEIARTGRADLMARIELMHCASRVASLAAEQEGKKEEKKEGDCDGFEKLRPDAALAERAYADFLAGKFPIAAAALLPAQQHALALATTDKAAFEALQAITNPLSKIVAAGVIFRRSQASPVVIAMAVETASAQGWRRPLLAWLGVQRARAEKAGDQPEVARLQRRIALIENAAVSPPQAP